MPRWMRWSLFALETMVKARPESTLTNWVADAIQSQSIKAFNRDIDFGYQNFGGIRILNYLKEISAWVKYSSSCLWQYRSPGYHWGQWSYSFYVIYCGCWRSPVSSNVQMSIQAGKISRYYYGKPTNTHQMYTIALPDYIANGGDNADFF